MCLSQYLLLGGSWELRVFHLNKDCHSQILSGEINVKLIINSWNKYDREDKIPVNWDKDQGLPDIAACVYIWHHTENVWSLLGNMSKVSQNMNGEFGLFIRFCITWL